MDTISESQLYPNKIELLSYTHISYHPRNIVLSEGNFIPSAGNLVELFTGCLLNSWENINLPPSLSQFWWFASTIPVICFYCIIRHQFFFMCINIAPCGITKLRKYIKVLKPTLLNHRILLLWQVKMVIELLICKFNIHTFTVLKLKATALVLPPIWMSKVKRTVLSFHQEIV